MQNYVNRLSLVIRVTYRFKICVKKVGGGIYSSIYRCVSPPVVLYLVILSSRPPTISPPLSGCSFYFSLLLQVQGESMEWQSCPFYNHIFIPCFRFKSQQHSGPLGTTDRGWLPLTGWSPSANLCQIIRIYCAHRYASNFNWAWKYRK